MIIVKDKRKETDLFALAGCLAIYAVIQGLILVDVIGPFWQLNIILVCINVIFSGQLELD